jgi:hypothetical protein
MKKIAVPFLVLGFASAMFVASSVEANDQGSLTTKSSHRTRPCRKVTVAAMSRTSAPVNGTRDIDRDSPFNSDYAAQHPSGGG